MTRSFLEYVWVYTGALPWVITILLLGQFNKDRHGRWGKQLIITLYGWFFAALTGFFLILKVGLNVVRSDPYDVTQLDWAFPCDVAFCAAALSTYTIGYSLLWKLKMSATWWATFLLILVAFPLVMILFHYNTWFEVLISLALGIVTTACFLLYVRAYLSPRYISVMLYHPLFRSLMTIDNQIRDNNEADYALDVIEPIVLDLQKQGLMW